ncbi:hypothetical protein [Nocardia sp. XZ_19_369]|uniref:hypothetical protein n=1 Tax=Nocardia sp. XZ_19_369 TaxID=2769487 RepID=UPI00188EB451|nr:hypothetical protein [Nocardia sp. XZ_19_369]
MTDIIDSEAEYEADEAAYADAFSAAQLAALQNGHAMATEAADRFRTLYQTINDLRLRRLTVPRLPRLGYTFDNAAGSWFPGERFPAEELDLPFTSTEIARRVDELKVLATIAHTTAAILAERARQYQQAILDSRRRSAHAELADGVTTPDND